MNLRIDVPILLGIISMALAYCAVKAFGSHKSIGKAVGWLELSLIPPVLGNILIIVSHERIKSLIGCYLFFLGMNSVIFSLVWFTNEYCQGIGNGSHKPTVVYFALIADSVQLLMNPLFGHAFDIECIDVEGMPYYRFVPLVGQTMHRIVDYGALLGVIMIYIIAVKRTPRIYREKYSVILVTIVVSCVWQGFYILSRTPVDRSMIALSICGMLIYYFALKYRAFRLLDRILSNIASEINYALYIYDTSGKCIWANEYGMKLAGAENSDVDHVNQGLTEIFGARKYTTDDWKEELVIGTGEDARYYTLTARSVSGDGTQTAGSFMIVRDTTEEQIRLRQEIYNSTHDSLTGLYTKQHLYSCIRRMIAENPDTEYMAVFIDVKNFKIVNDIFTSKFGDAALIQIADSIRSCMTRKCVYGRLAGDTFGAFIPKEQFDPQLAEMSLSDFVVRYNGVEHRLLIHMGVYEVSDRDTDVSVMFDRAHLALSTITDEYNTHISYYDNELRDQVLWEQHISAELSEGIASQQLRPYLQPITDRNGRIVGAEALARWIHPEHGFLSPASFIPVFERNGMIVEVDRYMWRSACRILADWQGVHDDLFISVNISPKDFYFTDVVKDITSLVREYNIPPAKLRIEITETVMMTDHEEKMELMRQLRQEGFIVEMDDFGSGYSSLSLLKDMPVDVLKIDMMFLSKTKSGDRARTIVRNIIRLSDELGIATLTEGVETQAQYTQLSKMGCKLFQGYFFAKPIPLEEFEEFAFGSDKEGV